MLQFLKKLIVGADPFDLLLAIGVPVELCKRLQDTPEDFGWYRGIEQIADYGPPILKALCPIINTTDNNMRLSAIAVLLKMPSLDNPPEELVELLIASLLSGESRIRYNATKVLGKLKDQRAVGPLTAVMRSDPDQTVREVAFKSIEALGEGSRVTPPDLPAIVLFDIKRMTDAQRLNLLREIAKASMDKVNAPGHLNTAEKQEVTARHIGRVLYELGGFKLMRKTLDVDMAWAPGCRTIERFWHGIGEWQG